MKLYVELVLPASNPDLTHVRQIVAPTDWKFETTLQDNELYYRTKLQGSLTLSGADFSWLSEQRDQFPCCVEVSVNVYSKACDSADLEPFWPGYFKLDATRFDFTNCTAEIREILPRDGYDALFRVWDKPINLLEEDPQRVPFVALYQDFLTTSINDNGDVITTVPDGNAPGTGYNNWEHVYSQGIRLNYALDKLLTDTIWGTKAGFIPGLTSSFYFAVINPVTGRKNLQKLLLAGSDAKRPASVTPAVKMMVTLKDMLSELRALHNVYYMIDPETGHLRLEHYSWFATQSYSSVSRVSLNLMRFPDALKAANNESVDLEKLYGIEELVIANNSPAAFAEYKTASVRYDDGCIVRNDKGEVQKNTMTAEKIWTALYWGYRSPESVPDDSIFLCDVVPAGTYAQPIVSTYSQLAIADNNSEYPGYTSTLVTIGPNGYQSAALLFIDYHRHGRSFTQGLVNQVKQDDGSYSGGLRMAMLSTTPTRKQEGIVMPVCCSDLPIDLNGFIKSNRFSLCKLDKGVFDPTAETITMDVIAGSRCQQVVTSPSDPGSDCPPAGHLLEIRNDQTYCDTEQTIVKTNTEVSVYADGACGSYEIPGPTVTTGAC